ncbi:MAG: hypothetical protein IJ088_15245 [Clostridia bacterium]|nr:hypothetical protein [Clostridia bacterium]
MSNLNGLASQENFEKFRRQWVGLTMEEAGKWTMNADTQALLTEAVLATLRQEYAGRVPSGNMTYFIRAQACLIFSITGDSPKRLREYIESHGLADSMPVPAPVRTGVPRNEQKAEPVSRLSGDGTGALHRRRRTGEAGSRYGSPVASIGTEGLDSFRPVTSVGAEHSPPSRESGEGTVPGTPAMPVTAEAQMPVTEKTEAPVPAESVTDAPVPPATARPAARREADTFYDPERTQFWTPGPLEETEHVVQELSLPDEEVTDPPSPRLSLINTCLFIAMIASFIFMVYESRVIQHYLL